MSTSHSSSAETTAKAASSIPEVEETVARISAYKGVTAVLILHGANIVQSTLSEEEVISKAALLLKITALAKNLLNGDLQFIRLNEQQGEVLIAPYGEYLLVVWHNPTMSGM
jgi:hypothetical protein